MYTTQYLAWGLIFQYCSIICYLIVMAFLAFGNTVGALLMMILAVSAMIAKTVFDTIFIIKELKEDGE